MQWIRFIEDDQGDCLVVDELLADILFSSAIYLVFQTLQHTLPRVEHFIKLCVCGVCPFSNSHILSVNFCVCDVHTIQQQCGANRILSVYFCERDVCTRFSNSVR